jgi:hypothetical protein
MGNGDMGKRENRERNVQHDSMPIDLKKVPELIHLQGSFVHFGYHPLRQFTVRRPMPFG